MPRRPIYQPMHQQVQPQVAPKQQQSVVLAELALVLGLLEGYLYQIVRDWQSTQYAKAGVLMVLTILLFAGGLRLAEPILRQSASVLAAIDRTSGVFVKIGLHSLVLFLLYVGYVNVFFK